MAHAQTQPILGILFLLVFIAGWLGITGFLGRSSGWFQLMAKYPDRPESAILRLRGLSGTLGSSFAMLPGTGVRMTRMLSLSVCPSGLRVGMFRLFGPFCRDFFVPWNRLTVERKTYLLWPVARLRFGDSIVETLSISGNIADRLARASQGNWPETGSFRREKRVRTVQRLLIQWAIATAPVALFFTYVPRLTTANETSPPIWATILLPAAVFGVSSLVTFFRETGGN